MTTATGLAATVDIAAEVGTTRIGPTADTAALRVGPGASLRLALLCGRAPSDVAAARAIALASCADVTVVLRADDGVTLIERANTLRDARPAAALVVANDADGVADLGEALRLAFPEPDARPLVLAAAAERVRKKAQTAFAAVAAEAMPIGTTGSRDAVVARLRVVRRAGADVVLRDEAIEAAARSLAAETQKATTVVDVSGGTTSLVHASPDRVLLAAHAHVGVGAAADRVVRAAGLDHVRRWMPRSIDAPALLDRVFNRARWPGAVAATPLALLIEMALAREAIAHVIAELARAGLSSDASRSAPSIVATGAIASWPRGQQTLLALIDALAPSGTHVISRDPSGAFVAAGAIASRTAAPLASTIEPLALVKALSPKGTDSITIRDQGGPVDERVARVQRGSFFLVPTTGAVETRMGKTVNASGVALALGVVIDARGRPLVLPARDAERLPTLLRWSTGLDALPQEVGA